MQGTIIWLNQKSPRILDSGSYGSWLMSSKLACTAAAWTGTRIEDSLSAAAVCPISSVVSTWRVRET